MGCGTSFVKYVLFFFNLLVAILGLAVIGIGVAFLLNVNVIKDEIKSNITVAPWVFIIIGSIMFIIAFFGCCGAIRESHCMVVTYAIFLLVIIIMQVVIAVLLFVYGDNFKGDLKSSVNTLFDRRRSSDVDPAAEAIIDQIQEQFTCCGKHGPSEYAALTLPKSCCKTTGIAGTLAGGSCTVIDANKEGCSDVIANLYEKWNKPIAGIAIGVACIEVVGALFALCLANSIRNMDRRSRY